VNPIRSDIFRQRRNTCVAVFLACLAISPVAVGQSSPIAQRLPSNTVFYVEWRGQAFVASQAQKNHLLQLVHDPSFAPMWLAAADKWQQGAQKSAGPAAAMILPDVASFLDNAAVFGVIMSPDAMKTPAAGKPASPFAPFVVYDATGKSDLIQKWKALSVVGSKTPVDVTKYDFGGASVEVRTTGKDVSYSAQAGNFFLASQQKHVIEELITHFRGAEATAASLGQSSEYGQMQKYFGTSSALELFARIPDMSQWKTSEKSAESFAKFSKNVHLEKVHVMGGAISFDGEAMRFRGAVLGDTSPVGPFDLAGASSASFQAQPVVAAGSNFTMTRLNLAALYELARGAIIGNLTPQQSANVTTMEGAAQNFLGMPLVDALKLSTGELASTSFYADDGTPEQIFAVTIQKPDAVLRVLRAIIGTMIVGEDATGTTTYLDLAYPYRDPKTGVQRRRFYYVAVTPQMILAAPRKAMLRQAMQRVTPGTADPPMGGVFANPQYAQLRSRLPEKLSGLSGADLTQIPWDKVIGYYANQASQGASQSNGQKPPDLSWLKPAVITRYLHITLSGWWKDSNGVYFDSYLQ
jgi:hypothetical protein